MVVGSLGGCWKPRELYQERFFTAVFSSPIPYSCTTGSQGPNVKRSLNLCWYSHDSDSDMLLHPCTVQYISNLVPETGQILSR